MKAVWLDGVLVPAASVRAIGLGGSGSGYENPPRSHKESTRVIVWLCGGGQVSASDIGTDTKAQAERAQRIADALGFKSMLSVWTRDGERIRLGPETDADDADGGHP